MEWLPLIVLGLLAAVWINTLLLTEHNSLQYRDAPSLGKTLSEPAVIALLYACFLLQVSFGPTTPFSVSIWKSTATPAA
jgi:hypothetical protein